LFGLLLRTFAFVRWKPHAVVASSTYPLDIFPCWLIARLAGAKLVHEVHDLWPLSPMELGGLSPRNPYIMVMQCAENFACRSADAVVSILPAAKAHLVQHGMAPEKFTHVPNGILLSEWPENPPPSVHDALLRSWKEEGLFLAGYVGGHGVSNALETMVDAAAFFANQPVAFVFVGKGPEKERLRARAESLAARTSGALRIHFLDAVPKAQIPSLLSHFDILCHTCDRKSIYRFGISPNKTFDYMMSGRPILQALEAGNDLVKEASCGWSVPPEDPAAFAQGLSEARDAGAAEQARRGANGKRFVLANHTFGELSRRFLAAFSIDSKR
jgi:glycosyltransferase involved in cell wall biosynthesis